jgi:hypothetical protein
MSSVTQINYEYDGEEYTFKLLDANYTCYSEGGLYPNEIVLMKNPENGLWLIMCIQLGDHRKCEDTFADFEGSIYLNDNNEIEKVSNDKIPEKLNEIFTCFVENYNLRGYNKNDMLEKPDPNFKEMLHANTYSKIDVKTALYYYHVWFAGLHSDECFKKFMNELK